ncbi:MAG TPA: TlyA family RNA methyltransferase, partial [Acidimicrobiia bacterium]
REVLERVAAGLADVGLPVVAMIAAPITGADGNREFLAYVERDHAPADPGRLAAVADRATAA